MRRRHLTLLLALPLALLGPVAPAVAQSPPAQLLPGQVLPAVPPPPGPAQPAAPPPGTAAPLAPVQPAQPDWIAQPGVELRAIDKVMARTLTLSGRVGQPVRLGPLVVLVRACVVRPPDRAPDAAAFLDIVEPGAQTAYRSWQVRSVPQMNPFSHPLYDIQVAGCRP